MSRKLKMACIWMMAAMIVTISCGLTGGLSDEEKLQTAAAQTIEQKRPRRRRMGARTKYLRSLPLLQIPQKIHPWIRIPATMRYSSVKQWKMAPTLTRMITLLRPGV